MRPEKPILLTEIEKELVALRGEFEILRGRIQLVEDATRELVDQYLESPKSHDARAS